jgi:hypothetical protein
LLKNSGHKICISKFKNNIITINVMVVIITLCLIFHATKLNRHYFTEAVKSGIPLRKPKTFPFTRIKKKLV